MHMFVLPRSPKELRVDIPETLEQIVMRALRKDCNDRYECAADMREAIEAIRDIEIRKQRQRRFEALFERCLAALQKEEWETATQLLKQADILEPGNERVQVGLQEAEEHQRLKRLCERARQCIEVEDWEEARECLSEILNIDPSYGGGYAEKQLEQVQHELGQKRIYSDSMIHYRVGMGYFRKWQWTEVVIELEQVITHIPEFKDVSSRLVEAREYLRAEQLIEQARLCREQGEWEAAVDLLEEAARLKPPHIDVSKELENTRAERAKVRAEQRLDAWYKEGIAQLEAENLNQAKESFKKIRERQPDYRDVDNQIEEIEKKLKVKQFFEQGSQHEDSDEWEQAIDTYRKILDIESLNEEAGRRLSRAMRHVARRGQQGIYHRVTATIRNWWNSQKDRTRMGLLATFGVIILALCVGTVLVAGMPPFPPSPMPTATLQTSYVIGKTTFIVNRIPVEDIIKPLIVDTHQVDIEIEVRDTKGNLFSSNQVICQWSFDPAPQVETLGDKGECNKSYQMPEGADSQLVKVVVQGRNGGQIRGASTKSIEIVVQGKGAANE
jgi:tetratricopeptide (TPR) repeat protein